MPLLTENTYRPPYWLRNGHTNTIVSGLFRKSPKVRMKRNMIRTTDDDIVLVDRLAKGNGKLAVLCHGLEGSSQSSYIQSMAYSLYQEGYDILALNFRSCGGVMNRQLRMYHSGETGDLHMALKYYQDPYHAIALVGFSLGGNVILKYLGENPSRVHHKVRAAVAISAPIDLAGSSKQIDRKENYLYREMFLRSLSKKVRAKSKQFPNQVDVKKLGDVKSLYDFDNYFTAPVHGFKDANDYYRKASSNQFLFDIALPTMLMNAKDDPFLSDSCYPEKLAKFSDSLFLQTPDYGGHVGFKNPGSLDYHVEEAISFLKVHTPSRRSDLSWHL